jgi:hypothetical protein
MRRRGRSAMPVRGIVLAVLVVTVVAIVAVWLRGPGAHFTVARCGVDTKRIIVAPHEMHQVVIYESDCDKSGVTTQVSVAPTGAKFRPDTHPPSFGVRGTPPLAVKWLSDNEVEIVVPEGEVVRREAKADGDVTIIYR